jgi:hypothetical protein
MSQRTPDVPDLAVPTLPPFAAPVADALDTVSVRLERVVRLRRAWDTLAVTVQRAEVKLRNDVCLLLVLLTCHELDASAVVDTARAEAIRTAQQLAGCVAAAGTAPGAPARAIAGASRALAHLVRVLDATGPARSPWN